MKRKEKTLVKENKVNEPWALPKKIKSGFDQALLDLGVHVRN